MQRFQAYATTADGTRVPGATIQVVLAADGVTPATIYSDNLVNPTPQNPTFEADDDGYFTFYAKNGRYTIITSDGTDLTIQIDPPITYADILLFDPLDEIGTGYMLGKIIDIRAYGAKCDGITDDTAAFRAALAALTYPNGGTLLLPAASTILISDFLQIVSVNVTIQGGGRSTIIQTTVGNTNLFQTATFAGITFRDFDITCNAVWTSGYAFATAGGEDDILLENVHVSNFGAVIHLATAARAVISQCAFTAPGGGGTAISVSASPDGILDDSAIFGFDTVLELASVSDRWSVDQLYISASGNHTGTAFDLSSSDYCTFRRVVATGPDGFGRGFVGEDCHQLHLDEITWVAGATTVVGDIVDLTNCAHVQFTNSHLYNVDAGVTAVELDTCDYATIQDVHGNAGLSFLGVTNSRWVTVTACDWTLAASNVLVITTGSTYWTVIGNNFTNNAQGVSIQPGCNYGKAIGNLFFGSSGTFGVGIELFGCQTCLIQGNVCRSNHTNGIHMENADTDPANWPSYNSVADNICIDNLQDGIYVQNHKMTRFAGNVCGANGRHGININSGTQIQLVINNCYNNAQTDVTGCGIIVDTTNNVQLVGNQCNRITDTGGPSTGSQTYGILIQNTASAALIAGNYATGNATAQIQNNSGGAVTGTNWNA